MFSVRTVFVVGAGAGIDIGMPVGGGLSKAIVDMLDIWISQGRLERGDEAILQTLRRIARDSSANVNDWIAAGRMVAKGIEYTRLIHAFLNTHRHNDQVKDCAKLAIARSILEAEQPCAIAIAPDGTWKDPDRVKASWLPTLMYLLQDGVIAKQSLDDLFANFCIINFNYDRCIEQFLFQAVRDLYHVDQEQAAKLIANLTIFHPYGSVGILAWQKGVRGRWILVRGTTGIFSAFRKRYLPSMSRWKICLRCEL